jgi:hypothetical protein
MGSPVDDRGENTRYPPAGDARSDADPQTGGTRAGGRL